MKQIIKITWGLFIVVALTLVIPVAGAFLFTAISFSLSFIATVFSTRYDIINVIVYYMLIPISWTLMIDYLRGKNLLITAIYSLLLIASIIVVGDFGEWCWTIFELSVDFLNYFNYYMLASVVFCVLIVVLVYGILFMLIYKKKKRNRSN